MTEPKRNLIQRKEKIRAETRFNPNDITTTKQSNKRKETKYSSFRCSVDTKNKVNAIVSVEDFNTIEEALQQLIRSYERTMTNDKLQEYELVRNILDRKS